MLKLLIFPVECWHSIILQCCACVNYVGFDLKSCLYALFCPTPLHFSKEGKHWANKSLCECPPLNGYLFSIAITKDIFVYLDNSGAAATSEQAGFLFWTKFHETTILRYETRSAALRNKKKRLPPQATSTGGQSFVAPGASRQRMQTVLPV